MQPATSPIITDNIESTNTADVNSNASSPKLDKTKDKWLHDSDRDSSSDDEAEATETDAKAAIGANTANAENAIRNQAPRYYDWREWFPEFQVLLDNYDILLDEMQRMTAKHWTPWPEYTLYSGKDQNGDWKVIPFLHTFPAYDDSKSQWVEENCMQCPKTVEVMKSIPNLKTMLYSRLGPMTRLSSHQGWADLSNWVLRCHFVLKAPQKPGNENSCGMSVQGEIKHHQQGEILVFDDSKMHKAFNSSDEERIVLIFDVLRPASLPKGLAVGGHTEQLDMFINEYKKSLGL